MLRRGAGELAKRARRVVVGVESSCDDSAVGVVTSDGDVLAHCVHNQTDQWWSLGGIEPMTAARNHEKNLPALLEVGWDGLGLGRRFLFCFFGFWRFWLCGFVAFAFQRNCW
jgi:hypothetical protein